MDTWNVPFKYDCRPQLSDNLQLQGNSNACGQAEVTPCWVQRPWEKKLFMMYMLFISLLSIIGTYFKNMHFKSALFSSKEIDKNYSIQKFGIFGLRFFFFEIRYSLLLGLQLHSFQSFFKEKTNPKRKEE